MSRRKQKIITTSDDAMCFKYEIYFIWQAAQNVRDKPVKQLMENMDVLDEKIKELSRRIDDVFGDLAKELNPR